MSREAARSDPEGKTINVKRVRVNKAARSIQKVRCPLVVGESGYSERLDDLFDVTPSLTIVSSSCFLWLRSMTSR